MKLPFAHWLPTRAPTLPAHIKPSFLNPPSFSTTPPLPKQRLVGFKFLDAFPSLMPSFQAPPALLCPLFWFPS